MTPPNEPLGDEEELPGEGLEELDDVPAPGEEEEPPEASAEDEGDEPPAGYLALVEEFGREEADRIYGEKLGIKPEEAEDEPEADNEEWAFDQLVQDAEDEGREADEALAVLAGQMEVVRGDYGANNGEINQLKTKRSGLQDALDRGEVDDMRSTSRSIAELSEKIAELTGANRRLLDEWTGLTERKNERENASKESAARARTLQAVERNAGKYPQLKANKSIYARLAVEGRIPKAANLTEIVGLIRQERVKLGLPAEGKSGKPRGGKPAKSKGGADHPGKLGWRELQKRLGAPARVGGGRGRAPGGKPSQSRRTGDPALDSVFVEIDEFVTQVEKRKGGNK